MVYVEITPLITTSKIPGTVLKTPEKRSGINIAKRDNYSSTTPLERESRQSP
jgi:hypothetical protein